MAQVAGEHYHCENYHVTGNNEQNHGDNNTIKADAHHDLDDADDCR